MTGNMNN